MMTLRRPNGRWSRIAATVFAVVVVTPIACGNVLSALVAEGDEIPGVGVVTKIADIAVNQAGDWIVQVDTDHPDSSADGAVLRNGVLIAREGDALTEPAGSSIGNFGALSIDSEATAFWRFPLDDAPSTSNTGLFRDTTLLILEGSPSTAPGFAPSTEWLDFFNVKTGAADTVLVLGAVDDPTIAGSFDPAIVLAAYDAGTGTLSETMVAARGQVLAGQTSGVDAFETNAHGIATNASGQALFVVETFDVASQDTAIYLDGMRLAQEKPASPAPGAMWSNLGSTARVDLADSGDWVIKGQLIASGDADFLIVRNDVVLVREGDPAPGIPGGPVLGAFGAGPVLINDLGEVLWFGDWDSFDEEQDTALFIDDEPIVEEGVTMIDGALVQSIVFTEGAYAMSPDGRYVVFEADLDDGRSGVFLVDRPIAEPCGSDVDSDGMIGFSDLLAVLANWGPCGSAVCDADTSGNGIVDFSDVLDILVDWGDCD